jgi:hypothetical protein
MQSLREEEEQLKKQKEMEEKAKREKQRSAVKRRREKEDEGVVDYSKVFSSFYDIFVGNQIDPKNFDLSYAVRDTRNLYAVFVNIMDKNAILLNQKYQFDKAPTEFTYKDFGIFPAHIIQEMGKSLQKVQAEGEELADVKQEKQKIIQAAIEQHRLLQERYQA